MILNIKNIFLNKNKIRVVFKKEKGYFLPNFLNILRRMTLSDQTVFSPVWVKIKNIKHEFGIMKGVEEDTMELLMNIKSLSFNLKNCNSIILKIKKKGICFLKGKDFEVKGFCSVVNKNLILAKIKKNSYINLKIKIKKTKNRKLYYYPEKNTGGKIYLNSMISNLKKFNFKIKDNYESVINLKTSKSVNPFFFFIKIYDKFNKKFGKNKKNKFLKFLSMSSKIFKPISNLKNNIINNLLKNNKKNIFNLFLYNKKMINLKGFEYSLIKTIDCEFKKLGLNFL